jgi:hypothetical protein
LGNELPIAVTISGTAENGIDYDPIPLSFSFGAGSDSINIPMRVRADTLQEGLETVTLTLQPGEAYDVAGNPVASVFIGESSHVPRFRPRQLSRSADGTFNLIVELPPDGTFEIESSSDMKTWQSIQTVRGGGDTIEIRDASAPGHAQRFYRARVLPQ